MFKMHSQDDKNTERIMMCALNLTRKSRKDRGGEEVRRWEVKPDKNRYFAPTSSCRSRFSHEPLSYISPSLSPFISRKAVEKKQSWGPD